ncbi:MAG: hypothetical protein WCY22_02640 [Acholeplasmataceae bacterium]
MKKQRKLVVGFLLLLALVVSGFTYAYWAGTVSVNTPTKDVVINIGSGEEVQLTLSVNNSEIGTDKLVPALINGKEWTNPEGTTKSVSITFTVTLDKNVFAPGTQVSIETTYDAVIEDAEDHSDLVKVTITQMVSNLVVDADDVATGTVTVTVTLDEPTTKAIYDAIQGKEITITFKFKPTITPAS